MSWSRRSATGVARLTWQSETFAYAEGWDDQKKRYKGLRAGQSIRVLVDAASLVVKPEVAEAQLEAEKKKPELPDGNGKGNGNGGGGGVTVVQKKGNEKTDGGNGGGGVALLSRHHNSAGSTARQNSTRCGWDGMPRRLPRRSSSTYPASSGPRSKSRWRYRPISLTGPRRNWCGRSLRTAGP